MKADGSKYDRSDAKILPSVSIVIITRDRPEDLQRALDSLRELDYPKELIEIVVVEEADTPGYYPDTNYSLIPRLNRGWGYARNVGVRNARNQVIVFFDDDCMAPKGWLKKLIQPFQKNIAGVTGGIRVKDCNAVGYCENVLGFPNGGLLRIHHAGGKQEQTRSLSTCNCAYLKETLEQVGPFIEENIHGEDMEMALRVTEKSACLFVPEAFVYHKPRGSLIKVFRWFVGRGRSQVLIAPYISAYRPTYLKFLIKNSLTLRALVLVLLLYLLGSLRWPVLAVLVPAYYLVLVKRYAFQFKYLKRIDSLLLTPLVKITMDIGMEIGQLQALFEKITAKKGSEK